MTIMEQAVCKTVNDLLKDEQWASTLFGIQHKLLTGFYDERQVDVIFQNSWHRPTSIYDAYCFSQVWSDLQRGHIVTCDIAASEAKRDADVDGNNSIVSDLPFPFKGEFWGGLGDQDGYIEWAEPIELWAVGRADDAQFEVMVKPMRIPLEVGYTAAHKTLEHIRSDKAVARLPYGASDIRVMVVIEPHMLWQGD